MWHLPEDINDTHGHAVGDEVLVGVARALDAVVRTDEPVRRIGGDGFVVVGEAGLAEPSAHERLQGTLGELGHEPVDGRGRPVG